MLAAQKNLLDTLKVTLVCMCTAGTLYSGMAECTLPSQSWAAVCQRTGAGARLATTPVTALSSTAAAPAQSRCVPCSRVAASSTTRSASASQLNSCTPATVAQKTGGNLDLPIAASLADPTKDWPRRMPSARCKHL